MSVDVEQVDYIRFEPDYDADLSYLSETEAEYQKNGPVMTGEREVPWHEYRQTYGAVENYESFVALACRACGECGGEVVVDVIGGCDFYGGNAVYDGGVYHAMPEVGRKYRTRRELAADGAEWVAEHFVGFDRDSGGSSGAGDRTRFVLLRSFAPADGYISNWEVVRQSSDAEYLRSFAAGHFHGDRAADYAGVRFVVVDTLDSWVTEEVTG